MSRFLRILWEGRQTRSHASTDWPFSGSPCRVGCHQVSWDHPEFSGDEGGGFGEGMLLLECVLLIGVIVGCES